MMRVVAMPTYFLCIHTFYTVNMAFGYLMRIYRCPTYLT